MKYYDDNKKEKIDWLKANNEYGNNTNNEIIKYHKKKVIKKSGIIF